MKTRRVYRYEVTVVVEEDGTLIDPADAIDINVAVYSGNGVKLVDWKTEHDEVT